jgi:hypothetical protein
MATIRVSNQSQLTNALRNVDDGDTILLGAGNYSKLQMSGGGRTDFDFSSKVTIRSADTNRQAVVNEMFLQNVSNLEIKDLTFDYTGRQASDTQSWLRGTPFALKKTSDITLSNVDIKGHLQNGWGAGTGLYVNTSDGFTLRDSEMTDFKMAVNIWGTDDVTIEGNSIRRMNHDALFLGGIDGIRIEDNFIGDYRSQYPSALHKDSIQFYTNKSIAPPSEDVVIRGNTIESADHRHGILMMNELYIDGNTSNAARYKNILIEDNYIHSTNTHGITVAYADGVIIRNNTVLLNDDMGFRQIPLINVSLLSRNVDIIGNTVYSVQNEANSSWEVRGNIVEGHSRGHWDGVYRNGQLVRTTSNAFSESASTLSMVDQDAEVFSIDADSFDAGQPQIIEDLDFGSGDRLVLSGFGPDTFSGGGVTIAEDGGAVSILSAEGLRSVVLQSEDVTARASADGEDLFVYVAHDANVAVLALVDYLI